MTVCVRLPFLTLSQRLDHLFHTATQTLGLTGFLHQLQAFLRQFFCLRKRKYSISVAARNSVMSAWIQEDKRPCETSMWTAARAVCCSQHDSKHHCSPHMSWSHDLPQAAWRSLTSVLCCTRGTCLLSLLWRQTWCCRRGCAGGCQVAQMRVACIDCCTL